ncbi:MAG: diguanylate cyclase [Chroococcus sp. CMT-3BRIN-NPC107]|jgi:diguanylate cyclase (GGDEF)-like protein|nr:diguanylate cyclase [Chroococcus sp. CMT-3BRIN-NPC107]
MNANYINTGILEPEKFTVLIIDDNPVNLRLAVDYLEASGFVVLVAQDGESGLQRASYANPHMILLDVILPGIDGFETCRLLKGDPQTKNIPVIFMTALADTEDKVKGFETGAVDYVTKPIQQEELLARITTHLRVQALTYQLQKQNELLQQQALELQAARQEAEAVARELQRLVHLDGLTGVANRRHFDQHLSDEWRRLAREQAPISLILCDIDYFKKYNDCYGHQAGDACLQQIAQAIVRVVKRPADLVARYGGEEFAIILPNTDTEGAVQVAQLIGAEIELLNIPHAESDVSKVVTASLGISSQVPRPEMLAESLIFTADRSLYAAKNQGRNTYRLHNVVGICPGK